MRISLIAIGSTGDAQPMVALGKELVRRGHTVSLYAFLALLPLAEGTGIAFYPLPGDAARYIGDLIQPGANPFLFLRRLIRSLSDVITPLLNAMHDAFANADAVCCTFFGATPYALAERFDIPLYQITLTPMDPTGEYCIPVMRGLPLGRAYRRALYRLAYRMIGSVEKRYVHPWCEKKGVRCRPGGSGPDYTMRAGAVSVLCAFSEAVVPRAPEWGESIRQIGFLYEQPASFTPSESLHAFLSKGEAPLYIGFGSMASGDAGEALRAVLFAIEKNGVRAILAPGWSGMEIGALPDSVYPIREFVPHAWLFERVCAAVHHGGAGTTSAGLRAALPTLIVPFGSDQFFWGERIHALGAGPKPLPRTRLSGRALAARMHKLLTTDSYRENARRLRDAMIYENAAASAADLIERNFLS